ncbi:MAG: Ni-sirohydrochlorin a,c-diamide synthase, partial [Candidatus Nitrosotenuis sp.]
VALDKSFNFYYYDNFDALKRHGAKIEFFSPISDARPPPCSGLYIGGRLPRGTWSASGKKPDDEKSNQGACRGLDAHIW